MKNLALAALIVAVSVLSASAEDAAGTSTSNRPAWSIRPHRGMPCLYRNEQPVTPLMFWQWSPEAYEVEQMTAAGIDLFTFFGSLQHYKNPYWRQDGSVQLTFQDAEIRKLLALNPRANFMPRLFTTAPAWWVESHPEEVCRFGSGRQLKQPRESFASRKWLQEGGDAYRQAVRQLLDADYGKQLLGIHVTNGPWGENFFWDAYWGSKPTPEASDVSEPMRQRFIRYLQDKYGNDVRKLRAAWNDAALEFAAVQVPDAAARMRMTAGAWRDPAQSRAVIDYFECHNRAAVEMIDHFCRIVKEESDNSLVTMAFYGYTQDENWPIESDHRGISQLLRSKHLDMLSAPHTYRRRGLGEDGEMRQYLASAALHGKLFIDEGDDQTYLEKRKPKPDKRCVVDTVEQSQSLLYREFGNTVTHGVGLWYMDLQGGWFRDPVLVDTVGRMKKWADVAMNHSRKRNAQVAVISAPESEFYLGYRQTPHNEIADSLYHHQMAAFYRAGAPFDWYLIDDLAAIRDKGYKVFVFLDCFYLTDQQRKVVESLRTNNRTLLWFYAPGYASQQSLSQQRMESLTGFRFETAEQGTLKGVLADSKQEVGIEKTQKTLFTVVPDSQVHCLANGVGNLRDKPVIAMKKLPEWTSIFSAIPGVTSDQLRSWYADAGVHIYSDCDDVLSANESWLMLHTRSAGVKQVRLPRRCKKVTEITREQVIGENVDSFSIELPQHATAVFLLE